MHRKINLRQSEPRQKLISNRVVSRFQVATPEPPFVFVRFIHEQVLPFFLIQDAVSRPGPQIADW
jgi:hypothetical protein